MATAQDGGDDGDDDKGNGTKRTMGTKNESWQF